MSGDDDDDKVVQLRPPEILCVHGGPVDHTRVTLWMLGETLRPPDVTSLLGIEPTRTEEVGFKRWPWSPPRKHGSWEYVIEGHPPDGPDEIARALLLRVSAAPSVWAEIRSRYRAGVDFSISVRNWSRGFSFAPQTVRLLSDTGLTIGFNLYVDGEEGGD